MNLGAPEGTKDLLPPQAELANPEERWRNVALWRRLEDAARDVFRRYGYEEIRTPVLEYTALFQKSSGETSDVVQKEMFTIEGWTQLVDGVSRVLTGGESTVPVPRVDIPRSSTEVGTHFEFPQYGFERLAPYHALHLVRNAIAIVNWPKSGEAILKHLKDDKNPEAAKLWMKVSAEQDKALIDLFDEHIRTANQSLSLRPELTPGTIRALIEGGLLSKRPSWKLWYLGPAFRKERPQKGRFRQFTQLGVEAVGASDPLLDAETMILFADLLGALGVKSWKLRINSIGCGECRPGYRAALKEAVRPLLPSLCENCKRRVETNVFRVLDCKADADKTGGLPKAMDHSCDACKAHLKGVELALREAKVEYRVDPRIVRGLDYYTRTVYEFTSSKLGSQDALCGGGRYDTLVKDMGGPDVGSVGFAAGVERLLLASELDGAPSVPDFFAVAVTEAERPAVFKLVTELRRAGLAGDLDYEGRSLKSQMRSANRSGARWALVLGPDELAKGVATLKDMKGGAERTEPLGSVAAAIRGGQA